MLGIQRRRNRALEQRRGGNQQVEATQTVNQVARIDYGKRLGNGAHLVQRQVFKMPVVHKACQPMVLWLSSRLDQVAKGERIGSDKPKDIARPFSSLFKGAQPGGKLLLGGVGKSRAARQGGAGRDVDAPCGEMKSD